MSAWSNFYDGILLPGSGGLYRGREPFPAPAASPAFAKPQPAVAAIQRAAPTAPLLPPAAMALAPTAAPMPSRPISNTSAQMRGPNLLDLLSGGGKSSTLGMLLGGLGGSPSRPSPRSTAPWWRVEDHDRSGGFDGHGGSGSLV